jgi:type IV pilus assembly protein PilN
MRINLNLASKPYVELQPLYVRLRWAMGLLLVLALPLFFLMRIEERHAAEASSQRLALTAEIQRLRNEQQGFKAQMRQPQNAAVLNESEFLNQLFARKSFSWTAVMMDLETVLPAGVQVTNLEPSILPDGQVSIRMRVAGPRDRAVLLVKNLEHSKRFLLPRVASETSESQSSGGQAILRPVSATNDVNFDVLAEYNPLPAVGLKKVPEDGAKSEAGPTKAVVAKAPAKSRRKKSASPGGSQVNPPRPQAGGAR